MRQLFSVPVPCSAMKRRNLISPLVLLSGLFFVIFMISCGKDGDAGPIGPEGPVGPKGDPGAGSSEVFYSDWLDVPFKPDTIHTAGGSIDTVGYFASIRATKLTVDMLGKSDVKVYINTGSAADPTILTIPYFSNSGLYISMQAYKDTISMYSNADVSTTVVKGTKVQQFRYMIIPGNTKANAANKVNWTDYSAAKAYLKLND
ncbi:MAG: collagen-like triple helix repeat-containing protein [Pseudobacter sp.]|uniref:collagen-like triple helix repeat-containing protein n=1 Tax=Pseudobacter sp. TaxID=2045420 RepID=UPI003F80CF6D